MENSGRIKEIKGVDVKRFYAIEGEAPLDNLVSDGGFCGIFRTIGVVGDSLASGELESFEEGIRGYHDFYEYSWGQYMARTLANTVYNFSRGGMTAKEFVESYADKCGVYRYENLCQAYIIALGINDMKCNYELGDAESAFNKNPSQDNQSFLTYYARIIKTIKSKQPKAKIFLMTFPYHPQNDEDVQAKKEVWSAGIRALAEKFSNTYVLDFRKYAPAYDEKWTKTFQRGHMTPAGYLLTAKMVMSYIDWIIRNNPDDFAQVGFIGTPYSYRMVPEVK